MDLENIFKTYKSYIVLILIQLCFSGWHILAKVALGDGADPLAFALYRELFASCLMLLVVYYHKIKIEMDPNDRLRFLFLGFCSFVNVVGGILALQYISATRYSIMQPSIPVFATVISVIIGLEQLNVYKLLGILCAVAGAVLIEVWNTDSEDEETNVVLGSIFLVFQCGCMACLIVFQKPIINKYHSTLLTFFYYSIGAVITLLLCICWATRFSASDFYFDGSLPTWLALGYASIFATLFTYNAYSWVSKLTTPSVVTIYSTLQPVWTSLLSFVFYQRVITISELTGGCCVAIGLFLTVKGRLEEAKNDESKPNDTLFEETDLNSPLNPDKDKSFSTVVLSNDNEILNFENNGQETPGERMSTRSTIVVNPQSYHLIKQSSF